jgi:hypothetical protein
MRRALAAAILPFSLAVASCSKPAAAAPIITVYKTPTCGCCRSWVEHLRKNGFQVKTVDRPDLTTIKRQHGVPEPLSSCHTAIVDGYTIEGHVPADVIRKLLQERPQVAGLAVPGMPMGSPGMEDPSSEPYEVYTFDRNGPKEIYAAR